MEFTFFEAAYVFIAAVLGESFGTIFGGGSFLIQPALLSIGVEGAHVVANDVTAAFFASVSFLIFYRSEAQQMRYKDYRKILLIMAPFLILGAVVGSHVLNALGADIIKILILGISLFGLVMILSGIDMAHPERLVKGVETGYVKNWQIWAILAGLLFGFYDGFSGAGSGVLMVVVSMMIFRVNIKTVLVLINMLGLITMGTASLTFLYLGLLSWQLLIFMIPACLLAGAFGAKITQGLPEGVLRKIFAVLIALIIGYLIYDLIGA